MNNPTPQTFISFLIFRYFPTPQRRQIFQNTLNKAKKVNLIRPTHAFNKFVVNLIQECNNMYSVPFKKKLIPTSGITEIDRILKIFCLKLPKLLVWFNTLIHYN